MSVFYTKNKKDNNKIQRSIPKKEYNYENQELENFLMIKYLGFSGECIFWKFCGLTKVEWILGIEHSL